MANELMDGLWKERLFKQLLRAALFHDSAFFQNNDAIRFANCAQTVGNCDGGDATDGSIDGLLHFPLVLGVQRGGGFVEYHQRSNESERLDMFVERTDCE